MSRASGRSPGLLRGAAPLGAAGGRHHRFRTPVRLLLRGAVWLMFVVAVLSVAVQAEQLIGPLVACLAAAGFAGAAALAAYIEEGGFSREPRS